MNKKIIVGLALAGALSGASARASYAESVVDYTSGNLPSSVAGFTNAASALGEPSRVTSGAFGGPVDPFNAPYLKSQVVSLAGHVEIGGFSLVAAVPEPAVGALVLLGVGMALIKGLGARPGWIALLIWLAAAGVEAATISEDFSSDPLAQGWKVFGKASLFQWNAANQNLEVTWDSSQGNSYFYRPLPDVLGKNDDFSLAFELQLKDVAVGLSSDKPFTFEVAVGLFNRAQAMGTNFVRGTAKQSPNLAEFDYFPDSGFGATVSLALVSSNHQFLSSMNYPLEMTAGDYFQVTMRYTASNRTLRTVMTRNGESFGPIQDLKVSAAFTDFQVDTVAISSYNDEPSGGSLLAHGVVDNLTVTVPEPPITVFVGEMVDGLWQAEFVGRVGWTYGLEQTSDFRTWTEIAGPMPGTGGGQVLTDTKRASGAWFYRVRAER